MIEMYDRDLMLEQMKLKQLNDALAKNTQDVTEEVTKEVIKEVTSDITNKIVINMLKERADVEFISRTTGLSIDEINKLKRELN